MITASDPPAGQLRPSYDHPDFDLAVTSTVETDAEVSYEDGVLRFHIAARPATVKHQGWRCSSRGRRCRAILVNPHLPEWLPDLTLDGVRLGDYTFDLSVRRTR